MNTINNTIDIYTRQKSYFWQSARLNRVNSIKRHDKNKNKLYIRVRATPDVVRRVSDYDRQKIKIFINPQTCIKIHNTYKAGEESGTTYVYLGMCNQVNL